MGTIIYHNPKCSKSKQTLQLLQEQDIEPVVVEYLKTPPSKETLKIIATKLGCSAKAMMRTKEPEFDELNLNTLDENDERLFEAMASTPKLIERPIVLANNKAVIGRPPENILEIL